MSQARSWIPTVLACMVSISVTACAHPPQTPLPIKQTPAQADQLDDPAAALLQWQQQLETQIGLSQEQRAQFKAIVMRELGAFPTDRLTAILERLRTAATQPRLDQDAALSAMLELETLVKDFTPHMVAIAVAVRPLLTPEQRQKAIALSPEATEQFKALSDRLRDQAFSKMAAGLDLTQEQARGWAALKARDKALDDARLDKLVAARMRFLQDGDATSLATSLQGLFDTSESAEFVSWTATLSQPQRQRLVSNTEAYMESLKPLLEAWLST